MERLGGMACTHPAAARPRAGSGEASIGSKERSSKRDAGLGAWRLSLSGEAACVKTVAIFDGGSRSCDSSAKSRHKEKNFRCSNLRGLLRRLLRLTSGQPLNPCVWRRAVLPSLLWSSSPFYLPAWVRAATSQEYLPTGFCDEGRGS